MLLVLLVLLVLSGTLAAAVVIAAWPTVQAAGVRPAVILRRD